MKEIEAEVEKNQGLYPRNRGRITVQEVLRRAGLSSAALEKPQHQDLKRAIADWMEGVNTRIAKGAPTIRRMVTDRADAAKSDAREIMQKWTEAELEYAVAREAVARLTEEIVSPVNSSIYKPR
jgi:hypothetical protein